MIKYLSVFVLLLFTIIACTPNKPEAKPEVVPTASFDPPDQITIELAELPEELKATAQEVYIENDETFEGPKTFMAYPLKKILEHYLKGKDRSSLITFFYCKDGYIPQMMVEDVFQHDPYVVFKDLDAGEGQNWKPEDAAKYEPFYLAWAGPKPKETKLFWPYALTTIKVLSKEEEMAFVFPEENKAAEKGFQLFRDNCLKCHAINQVGGIMGPEFNIPKNITEYWTEANIISFAKNPTSFRVSSKMAAVDYLSDDEFKEIITYLKYISGHKLKSN
jgi:cytochrome c2